MSKRNCRRTEEERATHEKAISLRKMPDDRLVAELGERYNAGYKAGYETAMKYSGDNKQFITRLEGIKGIGEATIAKIRAAISGETCG